MQNLLITRKWRGEKGRNALWQQRDGRWAKRMIFMAAMMSIVAFVSACGSGEVATATPTPVTAIPTATVDDTPTATVSDTPTATAASTPTPTMTSTPSSLPIVVPTPTRAPVPTPAPTTAPVVMPTPTNPPAPPPGGKAVAVWVQVTDSCKQALPGGTFTVTGPGVNVTIGPTSGAGHQTIPTTEGVCPIQQGTCNGFNVGCASINLNIPSSGTTTYKIVIARVAPGFGTNIKFAICEGGSDCRHGPEVATVQVSSNGSVSARVLNPYPDGATVTWPTNKGAYSGTSSDPIMFHEFGIGDGSIQCDGDHDADDFLTGTPGSHCDSDGDRKK